MRSYEVRKWKNRLASGAAITCVVVAILPLFSILIDVVVKGAPVISGAFLTEITLAGDGIGNAIVGTLLLIMYASLIGIPIGVLTGVYVSEYGDNRIGGTIRFFNDVMSNFPSVVVGLLVYSLVVIYLGVGLSLLSGAIALAVLMIPIVAGTTEEALKMVPNSLREASLALGVARWRTVVKVMIANGKAGLITGALLAVARAAGETAPLIMTASWSDFYPSSAQEPTAALPHLIYRYAMGYTPGAYEDFVPQFWGAAFVLIVIVLTVNVGVRLFTVKRTGRSKAVKKTWKLRLPHRS